MSLNPKYIMAVRRDPKKKYFLISIVLANEPGALSQVSKVLAIRDLNILEGFTCITNDGRQGVWSFMAECKNPRMDIAFIRDLLSESAFVEKVEIEESRNGLIIDSLNFPVVWANGARALLLSADFIKQAFATAAAAYGDVATEFIYQLGMSYGKARWHAVFEGAGGSIEVNVREATKLFSASGMARGEVLSFVAEPPSITISLRNSFEGVEGGSLKPGCHFITGTIAGAASAAFKREMHAEETECISKGDERCVVVVSKI